MIKKIKTVLLAASFMLSGVVIGCSAINTYAKQDNPLKIWFENENGDYQTLKIVDDDTGVNYVVVGTELGGGYRSISICPRYNADGSLYVSK